MPLNSLKELAAATASRPHHFKLLEVDVGGNCQKEFDKIVKMKTRFNSFLLGTHERIGSDSKIGLLPNDVL